MSGRPLTRRSLIQRGLGAAALAAGTGGILPAGATAAGQRADWRLGFEDLRREVRIGRLEVDGRLPQWLEGTLVRNGPARYEVGNRTFNHWFDGLGHAARVHHRPGPGGLRQPLPPQLGVPGGEGGGHHPLLRVRHRPLPGDLQRRPGHLLAGQGGQRQCARRADRQALRRASPRWGFRCASTRGHPPHARSARPRAAAGTDGDRSSAPAAGRPARVLRHAADPARALRGEGGPRHAHPAPAGLDPARRSPRTCTRSGSPSGT